MIGDSERSDRGRRRPADYVSALRLAYDRRIFREFDLRKEVSVRVTAWLIPTHTIRIQQRYDPFQWGVPFGVPAVNAGAVLPSPSVDE